jgi:hypothetical protein
MRVIGDDVYPSIRLFAWCWLICTSDVNTGQNQEERVCTFEQHKELLLYSDLRTRLLSDGVIDDSYIKE